MTAAQAAATARSFLAAVTNQPRATGVPVVPSGESPPAISASRSAAAGAVTNGRCAAANDGVCDPSVDEIRRRAYEIYIARGMAHGGAMSDWLQAERQLREEMHDHNGWWAGR